MSKQSNPVQVPYSSIHWFHSVNIRMSDKSMGNPLSDMDYRIERDEKTGETKVIDGPQQKKDGLVYSLATRGWDITQGAITVERATKEQQAAAIADRKQQIATFEKDEATLPLATTLKHVWFPGDKPAPVEWIANNCYRRSIGVLGVLNRRRRDNPDNWDPVFNVYIVPREFSKEGGELEKLDDHVAENLLKDLGRKTLEPIDYFFIARHYRQLLGASFKESDLVRRNVKRGEAQRAFALSCLDADFPELNIAARTRIKVEYTEDGVPKYSYVPHKSWIDVKKLRHVDLVALNNGTMPGEDDPKTGKPRPIKGGRKGRMEAIESYIRTAMSGEKVQALTSTNIVRAMGNSPCYLLQALGEKLARNDGNFAAFLNENADDINEALSFLDNDPDYAKVIARETDEGDDAEGEEPKGKRQKAKA